MFTVGFCKTASVFGATVEARKVGVAASKALRTPAAKPGFVSKMKSTFSGAKAAPSAESHIAKMPTAQAARAERGIMKSKGQTPEKVKEGKKVTYSGAAAKPKPKAPAPVAAAKPVEKPAAKSFMEQHGGKAALIGGGALAGHLMTRNDTPER